MPRPVRSWLLLAAGLAGLMVVCLSGEKTPVWGQPKADDGNLRLTYDAKKLNTKILRGVYRGETEFTPEVQEQIDLMAKHLAYRLTWTEYQSGAGNIDRLMKDADKELIDTTKTGKNRATERMQTQLVLRLKEVLPNPRPIASINAARILARMTELGIDQAADPLIDMVEDKDPRRDPTRYWAFKGLKYFLEHAERQAQESPGGAKDRKREERCVRALLDFLNRKPNLSAQPSPEEVEGYRFLRREAIRALATSRYPAVLNEKGDLEGRTAEVLLHFVRDQGIQPPARLDERIEAAVGVGRLKTLPSRDYKPKHAYQAGVAAHHVGKLIEDLSKARQTAAKESRVAWRNEAARLIEALTAMRADVVKPRDKDNPNAIYVGNFVKLALPVLQDIEGGQLPRPDALATFLANERPPGGNAYQVYEGVDDPVLKGSPDKAEAAPAKQ